MFLNLSPDTDKGTVFDMCPPGSKMENGVCVPDSSTYGPDITKTATPGVSPMLILAAAAAFFFAG